MQLCNNKMKNLCWKPLPSELMCCVLLFIVCVCVRYLLWNPLCGYCFCSKCYPKGALTCVCRCLVENIPLFLVQKRNTMFNLKWAQVNSCVFITSTVEEQWKKNFVTFLSQMPVCHQFILQVRNLCVSCQTTLKLCECTPTRLWFLQLYNFVHVCFMRCVWLHLMCSLTCCHGWWVMARGQNVGLHSDYT